MHYVTTITSYKLNLFFNQETGITFCVYKQQENYFRLSKLDSLN